ncbi:peptidoglycan DD-metalloendopeptidase family protein [Flavicella sp.]|uniref:peptidoglycan DD-metalloendopeptidase family protein n=1 Tax=Flavicella sp. TaxID=2957742 RepID=UPI003016C270
MVIIGLVSVLGTAQNTTNEQSNKHQIAQEIQILEEIIIGDFSRVPVLEVIKVPEKDWIVDNWHTNRINAYEDTQIKFPVYVKFKDSVFTSPILKKKVITSHFGWRNGSAHKGIDIDLHTGDKVVAMLDGKVRYVKWNNGYGNLIIIRHFNGLETVYAHLSKQLVKANDSVKKGQVIGVGGASGNAIGSHLHLEVRFQGTSLNPEYFFDFGEDNNIRATESWVTKKWSQPFTQNSSRTENIDVYRSIEEAIKNTEPSITYHIIKKGDTLSFISHKYQISVTNLCKTNKINQKTILRIGQRLSVN